MRRIVFFITIMGCCGFGHGAAAQQVSTTAPPAGTTDGSAPGTLPDSPEALRYPDAQPLVREDSSPRAAIDADYKKWEGGHFTLDGNVHIVYLTRTLTADHAEFDENTGDATLEGHVTVTGGENDEVVHASHATFNVHTATGRFYDVTGTVGLRPAAAGKPEVIYANQSPFRFTGRLVVKTGPQDYEVYDGTVTSCQLEKPDWLLSAGKISIDQNKARASNSIFHLLNVPILYLPYVTHPRQAEGRQSGFLIPVIGDSSDKGVTFGEQFYWAINRSTDLTVGTIYYSLRGFSQLARFQYKGGGQDFVRAHYSALQDRGYTPVGGPYINQSGTDVTFSARHDFAKQAATTAEGVPSTQTRAVADVEYLSSFVYREAFTDNFNQAVSSDVVSTTYLTHEHNGYASSLEGDRYQGEKRIAQYTAAGFQPEQQVHIFHAPSLEFAAVDHRLGRTFLEWNLNTSATGLKRVQSNFTTSGLVERLDLRPELALPFSIKSWRIRPAFAARETFYTRSRIPGVIGRGIPPVESTSPASRSDGEVQIDIRPPALERTFDSGVVRRLLRHDVKHTIEPELTYRYVTGVGDFSNLLRFDTVDVVSDTNELEYGITQRLFLRRPASSPCHTKAADANEVLGPTDAQAQDLSEEGDVSAAVSAGETAKPVCGAREWISWRVAQKYFFNSDFGGAVRTGPRNVLDTTLDFTGIAFLTRARNLSPLVSRLRVRTSEKTDVEWDLDYDFCAAPTPAPGAPAPPNSDCKPTLGSSNVFVDVHQGAAFGGLSYAWLNAPARSYVEGLVSSVAQFSQMRVLLGWGHPTQPGLAVAANAGLDLDLTTVQYGAVQVSYNWNCCGISVEYRKYELGSARNESVERFNFTLANVGTAGNLRRAQQLF